MNKLLTTLLAVGLGATTAMAQDALDRSFRYMYNLQFDAARQAAEEHARLFAEDPMADIAQAAALEFSEFARLRILETEFFASDDRFDRRPKQTLDVSIRQRFEAHLVSAETKAAALLRRDPQDVNGLFAMALANGLRANYAALIEKKGFAALGHTRKASDFAERLLQRQPSFYDAYLSTGLSKYLVGTKPPPVRWLLRLGGIRGDVDEGMRELELTAAHGRYLAPFARLLLAVGKLRRHEESAARSMLLSLAAEFPANPLYRQEADKLQ